MGPANWRFEIDLPWLTLSVTWALVLGAVLWWLRHRHQPFHLLFSDLQGLEGSSKPLRLRLIHLPVFLKGATVALMLFSLSNPRILSQYPTENPSDQPVEQEDEEQLLELPTEGVALYLVLDRSGSMRQEIVGPAHRISRFEALKRLTMNFVHERPNDLIGLIAFARTAHVLSPLTLDHQAVQAQLEALHPVVTRSEDGTAIGYALFKTVNLIAATQHFAAHGLGEESPSYIIKSTAIVIVTDGIQQPSPLDTGHQLRTMELEEAAKHAANHGIKVYLVNIEPLIRTSQFRRQFEAMETAAQTTGGQFFIAASEDQIEAIYREIDELERSTLPQKRKVKALVHRRCVLEPNDAAWTEHSLVPLLLGTSLACLFMALGLQLTWLRRAP